MSKYEAMIKVLSDWKLAGSGLLGILLLCVGSKLAPIGFILIFNAFDMLGYRNALNNGNDLNDIQMPSYRLMQGCFQLALLSLIYFVYGGKIMIVSEVLHLFGVADLLFYLLKYYLLQQILGKFRIYF